MPIDGRKLTGAAAEHARVALDHEPYENGDY